MISFFFPVRSGSKRVKNKNIRKVLNYKFGLLEIKINHLRKLRNLILKNKSHKILRDSEYVFSTNCRITKKYLSQFKWIKVFDRSERLSADDCLDELVLEVPKICKKKHILWSHVTSPLFNEKHYLNFVNFYLKNLKKKRSCYTADFLQKFVYNEKGQTISHNPKKKKWPRTQDLKGFYIYNCAGILTDRNIYIKNKNRMCDKPLPFISTGISGFDIDNMDDFLTLKKFLKKKQ